MHGKVLQEERLQLICQYEFIVVLLCWEVKNNYLSFSGNIGTFIAILGQIGRLLQVRSEIADAQLGWPAARSLDGGDSSPKGSEITAAGVIYPYVG
jgi:hypothetical protein